MKQILGQFRFVFQIQKSFQVLRKPLGGLGGLSLAVPTALHTSYSSSSLLQGEFTSCRFAPKKLHNLTFLAHKNQTYYVQISYF